MCGTAVQFDVKSFKADWLLYVPPDLTLKILRFLPRALYRVIRNDCRGFNNLSYTIHLTYEYTYFFLFNRTTLQMFVTYLIGALYVHPL